MIRLRGRLWRETSALLEHERAIPPLPPAVRSRTMARIRAALDEGIGPDETLGLLPSGARWWTRWAAAAALLCVGGVAVGAYQIGARARRASPPVVAPTVAPAAAPRSGVVSPLPADLGGGQSASPRAPADTRAAPLSPPRAATARDELRLVQQAQEAVQRGDFAAALPPLAEHARRFKDGRLAEEREALRVKALSALGRADDARRAAADFHARFPRSVLFPALRRMTDPSP